MLPRTSRMCMYTLPFGYAARATRAVSASTGGIACGLSDIDLLLVALPGLFVLLFLTSLFLSRQVHRGSPVVSALVKRRLLTSGEERKNDLLLAKKCLDGLRGAADGTSHFAAVAPRIAYHGYVTSLLITVLSERTSA